MAQIESRLKIICDNLTSDPNRRVARVASPLLTEEEAQMEISLFVAEHKPDEVIEGETVELVDSHHRVIGGTIIWQAYWDKRRPSQEVEAARYVLAQGFEEAQSSSPDHNIN